MTIFKLSLGQIISFIKSQKLNNICMFACGRLSEEKRELIVTKSRDNISKQIKYQKYVMRA